MTRCQALFFLALVLAGLIVLARWPLLFGSL